MAEVEFTLTQGGLTTNGTFILNTDNFYKRSVVSSYIDVIGYKTLDISVDNQNVEIGHVAYYNSNKTFIKCDSYSSNGLQSLRINIDDPNVVFIMLDFSTFDGSDITPDQVSVTVNLSGKRATLEVGPGFYGLYLEGSEYDEEGPVLDDPVLDESIKNIKIGDVTITKIYLGSENISKVYLGDILIFGDKEADTPDTPQEGEQPSHEGYPIIVEDENIDITKDAYLVEMSGNGVTSGLVGSKVSDGYVISIMSTDIAYEFGKGGRVE